MQSRIPFGFLHIARKNNTFLLYKKILIFFLSLSFLAVEGLSGQGTEQPLIYTYQFTQDLKRSELEFYDPVETWLRIRSMERDSFMDYNLVLHNDENDFELRIRILERERARRIPPNVEFARLMATLASNIAERDSIRTYYSVDDYFLKKYSADWGMIGDFTPKRSFSEKAYGRALCLYREDGPIVELILLSDHPFIAADKQKLYLKFKEPVKNR